MRSLGGKAAKGSQAVLQYMVEHAPEDLQPPFLPKLDWVSPRAADGWAEYRDAAALRKLALSAHTEALAAFWPRRGPVWDGLARAGNAVVLVEAKAHVREFRTTPSAARDPASVARIRAALEATKAALGADERSDWSRVFFQYANRLAFLWWLRGRGVEAYLLFVSFLGDRDMGGPEREETWRALFVAADHALGLSSRHALSPYIVHLSPHVRKQA